MRGQPLLAMSSVAVDPARPKLVRGQSDVEPPAHQEPEEAVAAVSWMKLRALAQ